jgi:hypothetical protein
MKNLLFFLISTLNFSASNAQLFDGTIFGVLPGRQKDLIEYYEKKGFRAAHAAGLLDVNLLYHLIISDAGFYSFADEGKI